jgi:glycine amidinotransferase
MKINCYDTFTKLEEVVLGSISMSVINSIVDDNKKAIMKDVLFYIDEDLSSIEKILKDFGVVVHRPDTNIDFGTDFRTPYFGIKGSHVPLAPSDIILAHADKMIITCGADRSRFFEQLCYNKIFEHYSDSMIINMPMPRLEDSLYQNIEGNIDYFNNNEPLIDASNIQCFGRDIFMTKSLTANQKGIQWIQKIIGTEYRFHVLPKQLTGHIDNVFNILRPGLLVSNHHKHELPEYFSSWDVVYPENLRRPEPELISTNIQDDDFINTFLDINLVCLDQNTILVSEWLKDSDLIRQLESYQINPIFVPMRYAHFVNQGLKCMIQDTVRQGSLEDYAS